MPYTVRDTELDMVAEARKGRPLNTPDRTN